MVVKIKFIDFWPDFNETGNFIYKILSKHYKVEFSTNPELIFYSNFGFEHLKYSCKKIYYTGENIKPDFRFCDYAFSFDDNSEQNFHLPHFVEYEHFFELQQSKISNKLKQYQETSKSKFCSFMASNANAKERIEFVTKLMSYKKVDCSGPVLYNMEDREDIGKVKGGKYIDWRTEKLEVIKHYKFTIAFENERSNNYVTEKIFQPLLVKSIPIYWGAPNVSDYFNPKCFIDVTRFDTFDDAIKEIIRIDNDDELYNTYFEEPPILPDSKLNTISEEQIFLAINKIIMIKQPLSKKLLRHRHKLSYLIALTKKILKKAVKR